MSQVSLPLDVSTAMQDASRVFGRYVLLQQLGRGGMGTVYKAWQIPLKRYVAIKILHEGESEDNLARFMREAQTASQLHHSNIAAIYEVGNHGGRFFIAMQFIDGVTMDGLFERKLEREKLLKILRAASLAVHAAHEKGVVHRDLKPSNIMLSKEGRPFVLDFGIARQMRGGDTLTEAGMVVGTPTYMAPEQASGNPQMVDRRSDVWSLGVILYEILTGTVPHRGRSPAETLMFLVNQDPPAPSTRTRDVPRELEAVCMKALERERRRRYATAEQFADDVQRWLDGTAVSAKPLTVMEKLSRRLVRLRRQIVAAIVLAVLAGAAVLGWSVVQGTRRERTRLEAREAMAREKWTDALRLWERLGNDAEAKVKAAECQRRLDEMQSRTAHRIGLDAMADANKAWLSALSLLNQPGEHQRFRAKLQEAAGHARRALKEYEQDARWWLRLAECLIELRDPGVIHALSKAIEHDPSMASAYYLRAKANAGRLYYAFLLNSLPAKSIEAILDDIRRDTEAGIRCGLEAERRLLIDAVLLTYHEDYRGAEDAFRQLSAQASEDSDVRQMFARLCKETRNYDESELIFRKLCQERPNDPFLLAEWGDAALLKGQYEIGKTRVFQAIAIDPQNPHLRHVCATILMNRDALEDALREFVEVERMDPRNWAALTYQGRTLQLLDRAAESSAVCRRAAEGREGLSEDHYLYCLLRAGDLIRVIDESVPVLAMVQNLNRPAFRRIEGNIRGFRGDAYYRLRQHENALREFEQAAQCRPRECVYWLIAADCLIELNRDPDRARQYFKRGESLAKSRAELRARDYVAKKLQ